MTRYAAPAAAALALTVWLATPAAAQDAPAPATASAPAVETPAPATAGSAAAQPLEISADKGLVWDRARHQYTARGHAIAKQGEMSVTADVLTASYADEKNASDIRDITAEGGVILSQPPYTAYGDRAVYDVTKGEAVLTGQDLHVLTATEKLTARDRLTYSAADGRVTAEGEAVLTRPADSIRADRLTANFAAGADGKRALDSVAADGRVVITTAKGSITGDRGVYHAATQKAELTGKVVIEQGPNRLEGRRATIDMKTGVSQLFGGSDAAGPTRVKGIFYPKSNKPAAGLLAVPAAAPAAAAPAPVPVPASVPAAATVPAVATPPAPAETPAEVVTPAVKSEAPPPAAAETASKPTSSQPDEPPAAVPEAPTAPLPPEPFAVPETDK